MARKGPGGKEVGRVSVRVVPDTSKFAQELKAKLEKIERQLKLEIPVTFDTKHVSKAAAKLKSAVSGIDMSGFNLDMTRTETIVGNVVAGMHNLSKRTREIANNVANAAKRSGNMRLHWRDIGSAVTRAARSIRNINADGFYRTTLNITKSVGRMSARMARFGATVARVFGGLAGKSAAGAARSLESVGQAARNALPSLTNITRTGWIMIAVFTLAAPIVGLVAGLLAGLPSLAFVAGAAIAAIAIGFDGIKAAAKQLGPAVDELKKKLSDTFEKELTPVFKQLGKIFPVLEKGLTNVAKGLTPMVQAFTDVVTSAKGMEQIQTILDNTGKFLASLAPMIRDGTSAFLTLAEAGSRSFGQLSGVLNTFAAEFRAMSERVTSNGVFEAGIKGLAQVTGALLHVFNQLFESGLKAMAQVGGPLSQLIRSLGDALVVLLPILGTITNLFANVLGAALNALVPIIEALTPSFTALANLLSAGIVKTIEILAPILQKVAEVLNGVLLEALRAIEPVIEPIKSVLAGLAQTVGDVLVEALKVAVPLLKLAADFFRFMFEAIKPMVPELLEMAKAFLESLKPAMDLLIQAFIQIFQAIQPLLPQLVELAKVLFKALVDIIVQLMPHLIRIAQVIIPLVVDVFRTLAPVLGKIIEALIQIIPPLVELIGIIIDALMPIFEALFKVVQAVWPAISEIISGVVDVILGIVKLFIGILTGDWEMAWEGIKQIFSGAWNAIKNALIGVFDFVVSFFKEIPGKLLGALGNLGGILWEAGKAIIEGLLRGLKAAWDAVAGWVSDVAGWIADLKGPLPHDRKLLIPAGRAIMAGLQEGLATGFGQVSDLVGGMAGQLANSFDGKDIGTSWAQSVEAGTPAAIRAVEDMMSAASGTATAEWNGVVTADGFGSIGDRVEEALSGWSVQIDGNGLAKLVNKSNVRKARRG